MYRIEQTFLYRLMYNWLKNIHLLSSNESNNNVEVNFYPILLCFLICQPMYFFPNSAIYM